MRTAVTLGFRHSQPNKSIQLLGTEVPIAEQLNAVKEYKRAGVHPEYCLVELWTKSGCMSAAKLDGVKVEPASAPKPDESPKKGKVK